MCLLVCKAKYISYLEFQSNTVLKKVTLEQRSANLFFKGSDTKYVKLRRLRGLCWDYSILPL